MRQALIDPVLHAGATGPAPDAPLSGLRLAGEPGGDRELVASCVASAEAAVARAEYAKAVAALRGIRPNPATQPDLAVRFLFAESWARMYLGEVDRSIELLERARRLVEGPPFSDVARAEALYRLGVCRFKKNEIAKAVALFAVALELCDRSELPCDRLRAHIHEFRSRCHQRQRDWDAARADAERALQLAEGIGDRASEAHAYFQASLVAERGGQWLLAEFYAREARSRYEDVGDRATLGRILNNLGGLAFLLGRTEEAKHRLAEARSIALEVSSLADAAQATNSLAQVHLRTGQVELAEKQARSALELLEGRTDFLDEIGNAELVLGHALLAQGRLADAEAWFGRAEETFRGLGSTSHRAAAWVAQGDLARRRGDADGAAGLYRRAAEALQDFHF
jgi:tetratricopeptide (TPR) repeat protein